MKGKLARPKTLNGKLKQERQQRGLREAGLSRPCPTEPAAPAKPLGPHEALFESGDATLAERVDELLEGFGEE